MDAKVRLALAQTLDVRHWSKSFLVIGILKGYDPLVNVVLDETEEFIKGKRDVGKSRCS